MLPNPTLDKLQTLRLHGMIKALSEQQATPDINDLSFDERLGLMVGRELTERENTRLTTRLKTARLRHNAYDTTPVVEASIESVVHTIGEAVILVFLVMFLFLQSVRATLIPTLAVPVVLLAAFALLPYFGITINVLTMYAMVLAIGLLVDDAIVVVENVERLMHEEGLSPLEAARKSMDQISGALVGIGMVLSAVFVPMAFFGGSAGIIYKQFAVTIVICMALSVLVALVFTPALCATILKAPQGHDQHGKKGFFGWFNRTFDRSTQRFERGVGGYSSTAVATCWSSP